MKLFTTFAVALLSALPALAADCYPDRTDGSVSTYQQVAAAICNGSQCGTSGRPCSIASGSKKGFITGYYTGNAKIHCVVITPPNTFFFPFYAVF